MRLPIHDLEASFHDALDQGNPIVLKAPTGSGKSTMVPQFLADHSSCQEGMILVLQPRRMAARLLAGFVARLRKGKVGEEVGYQIRMERKASEATRILFITEGILTRMMLKNPMLKGVAAVVLDEFHERSLNVDLALALVKKRLEIRSDLQLVVMSATVHTEALQRYLPHSTLLESEGRTYPVDCHYLPFSQKQKPVWEQVVSVLPEVRNLQPEGNILVFMPGAYEIRRTVESLKRSVRDMQVCVLHGEMPVAEQDAAIASDGPPRIIVSTNVAETSLTIPGIRAVIDSGLVRESGYDPHRGINTLRIERISKASADQRMGRAGRTAPGTCFRLWTSSEHNRLSEYSVPEIHRVDLSETLMLLAELGESDPIAFPWFESPNPQQLFEATTVLRDLGVLKSDQFALTGLGKYMVSFPTHPRYSRMFIEAERLDCVNEACLVAAFGQARSIISRKEAPPSHRLEGNEQSDFDLLITLFSAAKANDFRVPECKALGVHAQQARLVDQAYRQFVKLAKQTGLTVLNYPCNPTSLYKAILSGFADRVALRTASASKRFRLVHGRHAELGKQCILKKASLVVSTELDEIETQKGESKNLMNLVTMIEEEWLEELFPDSFINQETLAYDAKQRRIVNRAERCYRDLVLFSREQDALPGDQTSQLLAQAILENKLVLKQWDASVENWLIRLNLLARELADWGFAPFTEEDRLGVVELMCEGATRYKQVKDKPVWPLLKEWVTPERFHAVDELAPTRISLPNGRTGKLSYSEDAPPTLSMRLQDLYDLSSPLSIAQGHIPLRIEFLAPNFRPVHRTDNPRHFWEEVYPQVKKDLKGRYPKHEWR